MEVKNVSPDCDIYLDITTKTQISQKNLAWNQFYQFVIIALWVGSSAVERFTDPPAKARM